MSRVLLTLEYDGTAYAGWQRQLNGLAVQQVLEEKLSAACGEPITVTGASRTDAGVHAAGQRAHFDTCSRIPPEKYPFVLNTMLPPDIRVIGQCAFGDCVSLRRITLPEGLAEILPPGSRIDCVPMADGGEGTVDAFLAAVPDARRVDCDATDPLGRPLRAFFGYRPGERTPGPSGGPGVTMTPSGTVYGPGSMRTY